MNLIFIIPICYSLHIPRTDMIKNNIGLVHYFAYKLYPGQVDDDLLQEGTYGLIKAVDKFDPNIGTQFSTYASYWIRATMRLYMTKRHHIHIPQRKIGKMETPLVVFRDDMSNLYPTIDDIHTELYDIINHMDLTTEEVFMLEQRYIYDVSYTTYGKQKGMSKTTARNKYLKLYKKIRNKYKYGFWGV